MRLTKKSEKFINAYEWNRELPTKTFVQLGINKLGQLEDDEEELKLRDLHEFLKCLEPNTLFRIMPYEKAKVIDEFRRKFVKEVLL